MPDDPSSEFLPDTDADDDRIEELSSTVEDLAERIEDLQDIDDRLEDLQSVQDSSSEFTEDLESVKEQIGELKDLRERVETLEDKSLMTNLEELSIEEEIARIQDLLDSMNSQELQEKLSLLQDIKDEYQSHRVYEKLNYLYKKYNGLEDQLEARKGLRNSIERLHDRVDDLAERMPDEEGGMGDGASSSKLNDLEEKLYILRDRVKDLREDMESGGSDELRQKLRERFDDIEDRISKVESDVEEDEEPSEDLQQLIEDRIEEVQERIDGLERRNGQQVEIEGLDEIVREEVSSRVGEEITETTQSGDYALQADLERALDRIERLESRDPGKELDPSAVLEQLPDEELFERVERFLEEDALADRLTDIEEELDSIDTGTIEQHTEQIEALHDRLQERAQEASQLRDHISELEDRLRSDFGDRIAELEAAIDERPSSEDVDELEGDLKARIGSLQERIQRFEDGEIDEQLEQRLQERIQAEAASLHEKMEDLRDVRDELNQLQRDINQDIESRDFSKETLRRIFEAFKREMELSREVRTEFEGTEAVAVHTYDAVEYLRIHEDLADALDGADLDPDRHPELARSFAYHAPCHARNQGIAGQPLELFPAIDGADAEDVGDSCSGISGTYGWKTEKYDVSMAIGEEMFEEMEDADGDVGLTECPTCAMQMEHGTGYEVRHPLEVLEAALADPTAE